VHSAAHPRHVSTVFATSSSGSRAAGVTSYEAKYVNSKTTRSLAPTVKSATWRRPSGCGSTSAESSSASGPATASNPSSTRRTHGTMRP
jgi:hypothetical protein